MCSSSHYACSYCQTKTTGEHFELERLSGGSDGDRLREIDVVSPPLVPFLYLDRVLRARRRSVNGRYAAGTKGPRIPKERWPEVAARAQREGLRAVARDFGVSHETVRVVLREAAGM